MSVKSPTDPQLGAKRVSYPAIWLHINVMIFHSSSSKVTVRMCRLARMVAWPPAFPAILHLTSMTSVAPISCVNRCIHFRWVTRTSPRMDIYTEIKSWLSLSTGSYLPDQCKSNVCIRGAWACSCIATTSHGYGTLANSTTTIKKNRQGRNQTKNNNKEEKEGDRPATDERRGDRQQGSPPGSTLPKDPSDDNLCERVMHPARINVSIITKQCLCNVSSRFRKGSWVNPFSQGTYVQLYRCCNCMMYHEFLIVNILL